MKKMVRISEQNRDEERLSFWKAKLPEERVEAVETIREHYYSLLGYTEPPRIKKIIRIV